MCIPVDGRVRKHYRQVGIATMKQILRSIPVLLLLNYGGAANAKNVKSADQFTLRLKPTVAKDGQVAGIEIEQTLMGSSTPKNLQLVAQQEIEGVGGIADRISRLTVRDRTGLVPLSFKDDRASPGELNVKRHWRARRMVRYPVVIRYFAEVQPAGSPEGPPIGLRPSGGGVSGAGSGFLLLPEVSTIQTMVAWDLSGLPAHSLGVISAGEGMTSLAGPPQTLNDQWFVAGPANRYDARPLAPLYAYWLGLPPFDARKEMVWAGRVYSHLAKSFGYLQPVPTYRIFITQRDTRPFGGGTALPGAFLMSIGAQHPKGRGMAEIHQTIIHEMVHQWVGQMSTGDRWFNEGLTEYYTAALGLSGNLLSTDEYEGAINAMAKAYYRSPGRLWSEARIGKLGYTQENIRETQYGRGAIYFANLNAALLSKSDGRLGISQFLNPLFIRRKSGVPITRQRFEAALRRSLGELAVSEFRAELIDADTLIVPRKDIFGPCYNVLSSIANDGQGKSVQIFSFSRSDAPGCSTRHS